MRSHMISVIAANVLMVLSLSAVTFPLEWNTTYKGDTYYVVEINPAKLGVEKVGTVFADGKALETEQLRGKLPGTVALRFKVPSGTRALKCEVRSKKEEGKSEGDQSINRLIEKSNNSQPPVFNLFAGALSAANAGKWNLPKGVKMTQEQDGIRFAADATAPENAFVNYEVAVPEDLRGAAVIQDIDVTSRSKLVWGGRLHIEQYDAQGTKLPETLCDLRWTTHMRPPEKLSQYHDEGHIHPRAAKLRFSMELRRLSTKFDEYGLPITDPTKVLPSVSLSHLTVYPAELLPFPKWNDAFFGAGVSGEPSDTSVRLGGENGESVFYQTHSRGCWAGAYKFNREQDLYFPAGAGTVEAWFKPDLAAMKAKEKAVTLFQAYGGYSATDWKRHVEEALGLRYNANTGKWLLNMQDAYGHRHKRDFKRVPPLKDGVWTHVALQWTPEKTAELYLDGKRVAKMEIPEFKAVDLEDKTIKNISDAWVTEFYFGGNTASSRVGRSKESPDAPIFEGWGDALRVSTGCRYSGAFTPSRRFTLDSATRALFDFDRAFDGVSGDGFGFIPACVRATTDRVEHTLTVDGKIIQYYPKEIADYNDPRKVLSINNYPVLPTEEEFRQAKVSKSKSFTMKRGDIARFETGKVAYPDYVEIANTSSTEPLRYPILVTKGGLDPRSFGDLSDSLLVQRLSDRENVNKVFQYAISASDYFMNHQVDITAGTDSIHGATSEALIMLNSYCGFECGPLNNMTANMLATVALCPASQTGGYGHSFQQVFYDGKNHIYDLSAQSFFPAMDNETAAYLKDCGDQPGIHARIGKGVDHFMRKGARTGGAQNPSYQEKCALTLNPGEKVRISYANDGRMNNLQSYNYKGYCATPKLPKDCGDYAKVAEASRKGGWTMRRDRVFPQYSTAVITYDGAPNLQSPGFKEEGDALTYRVTCCYPIVWGEYAAYLEDGSKAEIEFSSNRGKSYRKLPDGGDRVYTLEYKVKARHEYLLRIKAPAKAVKRFVARTEGEVNPRTYPGWVKPGTNELTLKCEEGPAAKVTFGWREPAKEIVVEGTAKTGAIPGFEQELVLVDPAKPLVLGVTGASSAAKAVTYGKLAATLRDGQLTLAYDATRERGIVHGDDNPETIGEFPQFAAVDIVDGEAVKTVRVLVSPDSRLVFAKDTATGEQKSFEFDALPEGEYMVFMLARFESQLKDGYSAVTGGIRLIDPSDRKKSHLIARQFNGCQNYLKAQFGKTGGRTNWKWDCANWAREWGQAEFNGYSIRSFKFPANTAKLDFTAKIVKDRKIESAAVMVLPLCDMDARRDLMTILFGLNCDPFHLN